MITSFGDKDTAKIFNGEFSRKLPHDIQARAQKRLIQINASQTVEALAIPSSNRLHTLGGNLKGYWSVSVNDQWRVIFCWDGHNASDVTITDYH